MPKSEDLINSASQDSKTELQSNNNANFLNSDENFINQGHESIDIEPTIRNSQQFQMMTTSPQSDLDNYPISGPVVTSNQAMHRRHEELQRLNRSMSSEHMPVGHSVKKIAPPDRHRSISPQRRINSYQREDSRDNWRPQVPPKPSNRDMYDLAPPRPSRRTKVDAPLSKSNHYSSKERGMDPAHRRRASAKQSGAIPRVSQRGK